MAFRIINKTFRRLFRLVMYPFLVVVVLLIALQIFGKKVAGQLLTDIFRVPVSMASVRFDHRSAFPETQIIVKDLLIHSSDSTFQKDIFHIARAEVQLNVFQTLYRRFMDKNAHLVITYIKADNVKVFFAENYKGKRNYDGLFKGKPGGPKRPPPALIELKEIKLTRAEFRYYSEKKFKDYAFALDRIGVNIQVKRKQIEIKGDLAGRTKYIQIKKLRLLDDFPLQSHVALSYMKDARKVYFLPSTVVAVGNSALELKGSMGTGKVQDFNLKFNTRKGTVQTLLGLLPAKTRKQLAQYDVQGQLELLGSMTGVQDSIREPHFEIKFACTDAAFKNIKTRAQVSRTRFNGIYSNGERNSVSTTLFALDTVQGFLGERPFYSSFRMRDFQNPDIDLELKSTFLFADLMNLVGLAVNDSARGEADVNISAHGPLYFLTTARKNDSLRFKGEIALREVSMAMDSIPLEVQRLNGKARLQGSDLWIEHLNGTFNGDPLQCALSVEGIVPFLLSKERKTKINVKAEAAIASFDADRFIQTWKNFKPIPTTEKQIARQKQRQYQKEHRKETQAQIGFLPELPEWLTGEAKLIIHDLNYEQLNFDLFQCKVKVNDRKVQLDELSLQAPQHQIVFSGSWDASEKHSLDNLRLRFQSRDLTGLLHQAGLLKKPMSADKHHQLQFILSGGGVWEKQGNNGQPPKLNATFRFYDGHYQEGRGRLSVRELEFKIPITEALFYNPKHAPILIDSIYAVIEPRYRLRGKVELESWQSQNVKAEVNSSLALATLLSVFEIPTIQKPIGTIDLQAKLAGKIAHFANPDSFFKVKTEGLVQLRRVGFEFAENHIQVSDVQTDLRFNPDQAIEIRDLSGKVGKTHFTGIGYVEHIVGYLYGKTSELAGNVALTADSLDIVEFLQSSSSKKKKNTPQDVHLSLPKAIRLTSNLKISHAQYNRLFFQDIELASMLADEKIILDKLKFKTCSGTVTANGLLDADHPDSLGIFANLYVQGVDMPQLLHSFNNFNQSFLTHEQLQGKLNAQIIIADVLPKHLISDYKNLEIALNFTVTEGKLSNMDFLTKKLNPLFPKKYLQNIPFVMQGKNWRYMNRKLMVQDLELKSSLFDVMTSGQLSGTKQFAYKLHLIRVGRKERDNLPTLFKEHKNAYDETVWVFDLEAKDSKPKLRWDWLSARKNTWRKMVRLLIGADR